MEGYNPAQISREFNVIAKQSLEKLSSEEADVFTTVSGITSRECRCFLGKDVDVVTPNGFEDSFVPDAASFEEKRKAARNKLKNVAEAVLGYKLSDDCLFIANSGRYEFRNKGIDIFIDALGSLDKDKKLKKECVAFVLIPAGHRGAREDLVNYLYKNGPLPEKGTCLTHELTYSNDRILQEIYNQNLSNEKSSKVKVIFVPSYLNGDDGIFNIPYYDLLIGFDLTAFPSYYEPWGYTPLESLMFSIPTITTSLAGFGLWVRDYVKDLGNGIAVIERDDNNAADVISAIKDFIMKYSSLSADEVKAAREKAHEISRIALWDNLVDYYFKAYDYALDQSEERREKPLDFNSNISPNANLKRKAYEVPVWKSLYVESDVPKPIEALKEMANNLWWSWNNDARELFEKVDPNIWDSVGHNPLLLLEEVDFRRLVALSEDSSYIAELNRVYEKFQKYMNRPDDPTKPQIAYFSMEFGIDPCLKIYSGGLGILAGDYLKEASDSNVNIVGVGMLYRYGYFTQQLGPRGEQLAIYDAEDFSKIPVSMVKDKNGNQLIVSIAWPGRTVSVRVWMAMVGKVKLILLDTDLEENYPEDRSITHHLYGGDHENRLRQEIILGIGGIRALTAMGIKPDVFHCNEGHAAFIGLERLKMLIQEQYLTFDEALEVVRASTLFTTHTPVPAGHDQFDEDMMRKYFSQYDNRLNISWDRLMSLGRCQGSSDRRFNMSFLATRMSQELNGVSMLHGDVSKRMFNKLWPGYLWEELYISYVTNGVHHPTWTAPEWNDVYRELLGTEFFDQTDRSLWDKIYTIDDKRVNDIKQGLKKNLFNHIRKSLQVNMINKHVSPHILLNISNHLNEKALTIGFARRFATYKRAGLLFKDLDRLASIVNNPERPVQFIYAGKAHPHDGGGQDLIRRIYEISQMPQFVGKIIFLENYDIDLAKYLVRGVDIWLNTPTRPLEASGTSGEKAVMNGTLHFSVLDGWWVEGYRAYAGWALPQKRTFENQDLQDDVDSETIYNMLEYEIIPSYYAKNAQGYSPEWINLIKNTMCKVAPEFTMKRQLDDYFNKFYNKLYERSKRLCANNYAIAKSLSAWKASMVSKWNDIEILNYNMEKTNGDSVYYSGRSYDVSITIDVKSIPRENVGVESVITSPGKKGELNFVACKEFELVSCKGTKCLFATKIVPEKAGTFSCGIRIFPKNKELPHKQDFYLLRWVDFS